MIGKSTSSRVLFLLLIFSTLVDPSANGTEQINKRQDIVIYRDDLFYSSFPSIVRQPDGELLVAFRRAPERRKFGETGTSHTDPNSYLMLVRSLDGGKTWSTKPELIYAHAFGGSQDPCLLQLQDGTLLCSSYGWARLESGAIQRLKGAVHYGDFVFLGGYLVRSADGGKSWEGPVLPPPVPGEKVRDPWGKPVPAYNRGAMCQGKDGKIYWAVASETSNAHTATHLMISEDAARTWTYSCPIAADEKISFNETSLYQTPRGDLIAFMRTEAFNDHTAIARSTNSGKSFIPWQDAGFQGHPHYALQLPDHRVLLVYGYRHPPFGIRARLLDPECSNAGDSPEIVLRADGGNGDLGYPWATMVSQNRALVVYYFNTNDTTRFIGGTFVEIEPNGSGHTPALRPIRIRNNSRKFVAGDAGPEFKPVGFNYDHDRDNRLLEEYWLTEWDKVESDFQEMKELGANTVRIHLQTGSFMEAPDRLNARNIRQLQRLIALAEKSGLYLDITGLGCYKKEDVPAWYNKLNEKERWQVQACFWETVAETCASSAAVFCYDLMNEPVISEDNKTRDWTPGAFENRYFVQRLTLDLAGRTERQIAKAWVDKMVAGIRKHDKQRLITVGAIPWALTWPNAKPLFYSKEVSANLDFVSLHFYPKSGEVEKAVQALAKYDVGKPMVIEELFPMNCSVQELDQFIDRSKSLATGYLGFYWGKTISEYQQTKMSIADQMAMGWLEYFAKKSKSLQN